MRTNINAAVALLSASLAALLGASSPSSSLRNHRHLRDPERRRDLDGAVPAAAGAFHLEGRDLQQQQQQQQQDDDDGAAAAAKRKRNRAKAERRRNKRKGRDDADGGGGRRKKQQQPQEGGGAGARTGRKKQQQRQKQRPQQQEGDGEEQPQRQKQRPQQQQEEVELLKAPENPRSSEYTIETPEAKQAQQQPQQVSAAAAPSFYRCESLHDTNHPKEIDPYFCHREEGCDPEAAHGTSCPADQTCEDFSKECADVPEPTTSSFEAGGGGVERCTPLGARLTHGDICVGLGKCEDGVCPREVKGWKGHGVKCLVHPLVKCEEEEVEESVGGGGPSQPMAQPGAPGGGPRPGPGGPGGAAGPGGPPPRLAGSGMMGLPPYYCVDPDVQYQAKQACDRPICMSEMDNSCAEKGLGECKLRMECRLAGPGV